MASRRPELTVSLSRQAADDLDEIYLYNIKERGQAAADRYNSFLNTKIDNLAVQYDAGKPVRSRPSLRHMLMKQRASRGKDGHIAVYAIEHESALVRVVNVFHTKQDWERKL